jgi:hypothetical protein
MNGGRPASGRPAAARDHEGIALDRLVHLGLRAVAPLQHERRRAASFQETTRVLTEASISGKVDPPSLTLRRGRSPSRPPPPPPTPEELELEREMDASELPHNRSMDQPWQLMGISMAPDPVIETYKRDVDRTLIRENLKLTIDERVGRMIKALRLAEALRRSRGPGR